MSIDDLDADMLRRYGLNRWAAFTDDELRVLDDAFDSMAESDDHHVGSIYDDEAHSLHSEVKAEQQRRQA